MTAEKALQLSLYGLCFTLTLLGQATGIQVPDPVPVNCLYTSWSAWTSCNPCNNERRRSRGIQVFGQFGGEVCAGSLGEREACATSSACPRPPASACSASQFQCDSGTCIRKNLECNWDIDCEDQSDETCVDVPRKPCGTRELDTNIHGRSAGYGINILGSSPRQNPFFNEYFHGVCSQIWDPTQRAQIRLPWNVATLHYETLVEETVSREIYKSSDHLLNEIMTEMTHSSDVGLSFKFGNDWLKVGAGANAKLETSDMVKEIQESTRTKNKSFIRVKGKVQFATYRMRPRDLRVADGFLADVMFLPLAYEKSAYFDFLGQYGTHYTRHGKIGGEYQLVYVLNSDIVTEKKVTQKTLKDCLTLGGNVDISDPTGIIGVSGNAKATDCENVVTTNEGGSTRDALVDKVFTSVKGGDTDTAAAMRARLNTAGTMDPDTYATWARSVIKSPAVIHSEPEPIYTLLPLTMPDVNVRVAHLKRAIADYVAEYSLCKCKPCHNGGTVVLIDGQCTCLCQVMFEGLACQSPKPDKAGNPVAWPSVPQVGNWGCWSSWSTCISERRLRVRACNREGLQGASCRGAESDSGYC